MNNLTTDLNVLIDGGSKNKPQLHDSFVDEEYSFIPKPSGNLLRGGVKNENVEVNPEVDFENEDEIVFNPEGANNDDNDDNDDNNDENELIINPEAVVNNDEENDDEEELIINPEANNEISFPEEDEEGIFEVEGDIEFGDIENIEVYDEEVIPEEKVILNEQVQQDDLMNQLMRMIPEDLRTDKKILRQTYKKFKHLINLKKDFSVLDSNGNIIRYKEKGNFNRPHLTSIMNQQSKKYMPVVSSKRKFFELPQDSGITSLIEEGDETVLLTTNKNEFLKYLDIKQRYKLGAERINYSYRNELAEVKDLMRTNFNIADGIPLKITKDQLVFTDCFTKLCKTNFDSSIKFNPFLVEQPSEFYNGDSVFVKGIIQLENTNNVEENFVKLDYGVGDRIIVTSNNNNTVNGTIEEISDSHYIVNPDDTKYLSDFESRGGKLLVSKDQMIRDEYDKVNSNVFIFEDIDGTTFEQNVKASLPTGNIVMMSLDKSKVTSFSELNELLLKNEDVSLDEFTENEVKVIKNELSERAEKIKIKTTINDSTKENKKERRDNFGLVNNSILDELVPFYGTYPLFNSKLDSLNERIRWLEDKPDNGELFYITLTNKINEKFLAMKDAKVKSIRKYIEKLSQQLSRADALFFKELQKGDFKCDALKFSKIYTSIHDMEADNYKQIFDKNGDEIEEGSICLLNSKDDKAIFKRSLESGGEWILEKKLTNDKLITDDKSLCNQNGQTIDEFNINNKERCIYDENDSECISKKMREIQMNIFTLRKAIDFNVENAELLENADEWVVTRENYIEVLKKRLQLYNNISKIKTNELISLQNKYLVAKEESEYEDIYFRIDKYLENISNLQLEDYYKALSTLIELYGREASDITEYGENKRTIYCRLGFRKEICCKHHTHFIEYAKGEKKLDEVLVELNEHYGVEEEGFIVCNNCGQHIEMSNYETLEGFLSNKTRDITATEAIETEEDQYESSKGNEMYETLKKTFLEDYEEKGLNVVKIINTLTGLMGLEFTNEDSIKLINSSKIMCQDIKPEKEWKEEALKRKKLKNSVLNKLYKKYRNKNLILYTSANLFVYAQSGNPTYPLTKTFTKCVPSLAGFPHSDGFDGVKYISCILDACKSSGGDWSSLEKVNIRESIVKIIDKIMKDDYIQYRYSLKEPEDEEVRILEEFKWNEFRPPLQKLNIKITKGCNNPNLIALKYIEKINSHINSQDALVTQNFIPKPLDGNCCLDTVNSDYNYKNEFMRLKDTRELFETLKKCAKMRNNYSGKIMKPRAVQYYQSFSSQVGIENLTENDIKDFFVSFVSEPGQFQGIRRIFDEDICIYTGKLKEDIFKESHTETEYYALKKIVSERTSLIIPVIPNVVIDIIQLLKQSNRYLNEYFVSWCDKFNPKNKDMWDDLEQETKLEINDICEQIGDDKKDMLLNLGILQNVSVDDVNHMDAKDANIKSLMSRQKLIKSYIQVYFTQFLFKLKNQYLIEEPDYKVVPKEWKLNPLNDSKIIEKYYKLIVKRNNTNFAFTSNPILNKLCDIVLNFGNNIEMILSKSQIYDCKGNEMEKQIEFNESKIVTLVHYLFVNMITQMLSTDMEPLTAEEEEDEEIEPTEEEFLIKNMVNHVLSDIQKDSLYLDKHSLSYIKSVILSKAESDKEDNLNFIKELDKDTWNSLKTMIFLGLDTWKSLSNKSRKLYIPQDEPMENPPDEEPLDEELRLEAAEELGDGMTEDDFAGWKEQRDANRRADMEAAAEIDLRVVVGDDDENGDIEGDDEF